MKSMIRPLVLLLGLAAALFLTGCGKGSCPTTSLTSSGSSGGTTGGVSTGGTVCGAGTNGGGGGPSAAFVFYLDGAGVETASLSTSGSFSQVTGLTPAVPAGGTIDDMAQLGNKFLYLPFGDIQGVQALAINNSTGALSSINGSPFLLPSPATADAVAVDPKGRFLFVGSEFTGFVTVFQVASDGSLIVTPGSPFSSISLSSADSIAVDGTGKFLYVGQNDAALPVDVFTIDQNTGALSELSAFPLNVAQLRTDSTGKFLFGVQIPFDSFSFASDPHVSVFAIDPTTGAPSAVAGSPFTTSAPAFDVVVHPNGKFIYVNEFNVASSAPAPIEGFQVNSTSGALTALPGSPFAGLAGAYCKMDPSGGVLVCDPNNTLDGFAVFTVNPTTGALTNTVTPLSVANTPWVWAVSN